jgi:hypothetical protein
MVHPVRQVLFQFRSEWVSRLSEESGRLEELVFPAEEFRQLPMERQGKEFRYLGHLYDIKSTERTGDMIRVLAMRDDPETRLIHALNTLADRSQPAQHGRPALMFVPYFLEIHTACSIVTSKTITIQYPRVSVAYTEATLEVAVPPPELLM